MTLPTGPVDEALALLKLDGRRARVMLYAIGLQESGFLFRHQHGGGPARGFWQFELGSKATKGGVWGVCLHRASSARLDALCKARDCTFAPWPVWMRLEHDDTLAAGVARLLLLTDPQPLPDLDDAAGAWDTYVRVWKPGKPRPATWAGHHATARRQVP